MTKRNLLTMALFAAVVALPVAATAQAPGIYLKADVPFDFVVGGETFPAGTYVVETASETSNSLLLTLQRADVGSAEELRFANVMTVPLHRSDSREHAKLVFEQVGSMNFLERVVPSEGFVREVQDGQ